MIRTIHFYKHIIYQEIIMEFSLMSQWQKLLKRLRKPSVIASLTAEVIAILTLLNLDIDISLIGGVMAIITSALITLGILSNPDSDKNNSKTEE